MKAYYNEHDPFAAQWLRNLIFAGEIAPGVVDERDIQQVTEDDLEGFTQCHFFAGIGGWPRALRLASWPDDRPVWTGSCPCQDFSHCGKQAGFAGERDCWPYWFRLIGIGNPDDLFGEQVDDSPEWWDRAATDLESIGYAVGATVIPACAVDARHERSRLYFAAHASAQHGLSHDRMVPGRERRTPTQSGGLLGLEVAGRWWTSTARPERMPTLVRNFDGLSGLLGGFGNAIVPELAAQFILAAQEAAS